VDLAALWKELLGKPWNEHDFKDEPTCHLYWGDQHGSVGSRLRQHRQIAQPRSQYVLYRREVHWTHGAQRVELSEYAQDPGWLAQSGDREISNVLKPVGPRRRARQRSELFDQRKRESR